jgi:hypothetical protein
MAFTRRIAIQYTVAASISLLVVAISVGLWAVTRIGAWQGGAFLIVPFLAGCVAGSCGVSAIGWWRDYREERASHERFFDALTDLAKRKG